MIELKDFEIIWQVIENFYTAIEGTASRNCQAMTWLVNCLLPNVVGVDGIVFPDKSGLVLMYKYCYMVDEQVSEGQDSVLDK